MVIYGVQLAQVLGVTLTAVLGLLAAVSVGVLLVMRSAASRGRQGARLVLEPVRIRVAGPAAGVPPSVLLRSAVASRAPPGAWSDCPLHSSAQRAEE